MYVLQNKAFVSARRTLDNLKLNLGDSCLGRKTHKHDRWDG